MFEKLSNKNVAQNKAASNTAKNTAVKNNTQMNSVAKQQEISTQNITTPMQQGASNISIFLNKNLKNSSSVSEEQ